MRNANRKGPSYLDVAEFILSGPFSPRLSPAIFPIQSQPIDNLTPLSRPLYIQIEGGYPSPYLKQLLSKVGSSEIEFMDFTLDGHDQENDEQSFQQQQLIQKQMSVIEQQSSLDKSGPEQEDHDHHSKYEYNPEEYIPNMHLLDIDANALRLENFNAALESLQKATEEERKEYILLYLTDTDLETYKDSSLEVLIEVAHANLQPFGVISRLERKSKVARYLQKKKKRIWKKKINYDCRKKVADNRLRVKGKFVTRQQACEMLGIQLCNQDTLKELLRSQSSQSTKMMF